MTGNPLFPLPWKLHSVFLMVPGASAAGIVGCRDVKHESCQIDVQLGTTCVVCRVEMFILGGMCHVFMTCTFGITRLSLRSEAECSETFSIPRPKFRTVTKYELN